MARRRRWIWVSSRCSRGILVASAAICWTGRRFASRNGRDSSACRRVDPQARVLAGAQLTVDAQATRACGYVTSSCFSPALQRHIGLALASRELLAGTELVARDPLRNLRDARADHVARALRSGRCADEERLRIDQRTMNRHATNATEALAPLSIGSAVEIVAAGQCPRRGRRLRSAPTSKPRTSVRPPPSTSRPLAIAPGRWLWLNAGADAAVRAARRRAPALSTSRASGPRSRCGGARARRALAPPSTSTACSRARGCASLTLFDCPAVLARTGPDGFIICVQSSYAASFERPMPRLSTWS